MVPAVGLTFRFSLDGWLAVTPSCDEHVSDRGWWDPDGSPIEIRHMSKDVARYSWWRERRVLESGRRCWCARLSRITPDHGLSHYLDDLWRPVRRLPTRAMEMRCVVCDTRWHYQREVGPVVAIRQEALCPNPCDLTRPSSSLHVP